MLFTYYKSFPTQSNTQQYMWSMLWRQILLCNPSLLKYIIVVESQQSKSILGIEPNVCLQLHTALEHRTHPWYLLPYSTQLFKRKNIFSPPITDASFLGDDFKNNTSYFLLNILFHFLPDPTAELLRSTLRFPGQYWLFIRWINPSVTIHSLSVSIFLQMSHLERISVAKKSWDIFVGVPVSRLPESRKIPIREWMTEQSISCHTRQSYSSLCVIGNKWVEK